MVKKKIKTDWFVYLSSQGDGRIDQSLAARTQTEKKDITYIRMYTHTHFPSSTVPFIKYLFIISPLSFSWLLGRRPLSKKAGLFRWPSKLQTNGIWCVHTHTHTLDTTRIGQPKKIVVLFSQASDFPMASYKIKNQNCFLLGLLLLIFPSCYQNNLTWCISAR
jgi:hypothetical protein